jgi:tRNA threonylcarbamoyladenosine biosynthesis protein TsaE
MRHAMRLHVDELNRFGETLGSALTPPTVIGLSGELGTGKTTLVQAICRGLGAQALATSPTYALVHHYEASRARLAHGGSTAVYHVDCYRLRSPDEARDLGFDDMMRERAIILVEWPERAGPWAPPLDRHFRLSYGDEPDVRELEEIR